MMTGVPRRFEKYVGLPWVDGGRSFNGVDCEGLCRLVLEHEAGGPPMPEYGIVSADGLLQVVRGLRTGTTMSPALPVAPGEERCFDVAVLTARGAVDGRPRTLPCHMGIMVGPRHLLHIEELTDSVVVSTGDQMVRRRLVGFVRHEALA